MKINYPWENKARLFTYIKQKMSLEPGIMPTFTIATCTPALWFFLGLTNRLRARSGFFFIVIGNVLMLFQVHAKHEEKSDTKSVYREYNREFLLPKGTNPEAIKSSLSRDGVLTVEAPLPQLAITDRNIPIQKHWTAESQASGSPVPTAAIPYC